MLKRPDSLAGKRVLITGGSSGIGLACAHELIARGARVALLARGDEALREAAASLDGAVEVVVADVSDTDAMRHALHEAAQALGGVDAVVANAAAAAYGPFAEMSAGDYRRTIEISLLGMINTAHAALPHLEPTRGTLVVVGSISGRLPTPWLSVYTAAKHGVRGFVRTPADRAAGARKPGDGGARGAGSRGHAVLAPRAHDRWTGDAPRARRLSSRGRRQRGR